MSLVRAVIAGTLVGAVGALVIYVATGPDDFGRAAEPATPTFAPVPTPTITELADCIPPEVLKNGFCVTTKPGPKVTATVRSTGSSTSSSPRTAPRPAPAPAPTEQQAGEPGDDDGDEPDDDHDD